jgi:hypothetical protein
MNKMDDTIEILATLPQGLTFKEMLVELNKHDGCDYTDVGLRTILTHLRKNCQFYGWTFPHVDSTGDGRYVMVLVNKDGTYTLDDQDKGSMEAGLQTTIKRIHRQMLNSSMAIEMAANNASRRYGDELRDWAADLRHEANHARRLLRKIQADGDGTHG